MSDVPSFGSFPDIESSSHTTKPVVKKSGHHRDSNQRGVHRERKERHQLPPPKADKLYDTRYFYSDRKGDRLNSQYGQADKCPKYNLMLSGRQVLGAPSLVVVSRSSKGIELGLSGFQKTKFPLLTDSRTRALLASSPRRIKRLSHQQDISDEFIPLPSYKQKNYRSIADSGSESDSTSTESSQSDSDEIALSAHQSALKDLEQKLTASPSSATLWLALLSRTLSVIPPQSKNWVQSRAEVTVSIIARAFEASPLNRSSKALCLRYINAGEHIWGEPKLNQEWEEALKSGGLWMEWLEWMIRTRSKSIQDIVDAASRVFDALGEDETAKLRVFWRVSIACQQAGFCERATAMFQAQAELSFNIPEALRGASFEVQLAQFQQFWESEFPRLGEEGAQGWAHWVSHGCPQSPLTPSSVHHSHIQSPTHTDPYFLWAQLEESNCSVFPSHDPEDPDPYSTVLFSDIEPLLLPLRSESAKHTFRLIWLAFLGLSIPGFPESLSASEQQSCWDDRWYPIHLIRPPYLDAILPKNPAQTMITSSAQVGVVIGGEVEYKAGFGPVRNWGFGVLRPLNTFGGLWREHDIRGLDHQMIRELFSQLRNGDEDVEWDLLALTFEAATDTKTAIKLSRRFLSTAPESLARWAMHASLERLRDRPLDSRRVYETVLASSSSDTSVCFLWWEWAEMEWLLGHSDATVLIIMRAARETGNDGVAILRAKRSLEDQAHRTDTWKERECWVKLLALLNLLITKEISAVCKTFDVWIQDYQVGAVPHESMLTATLLMLHQHSHVLKNATQGTFLRMRAEEGLQVYPTNSVLLGIFLEAERGQSIWGRVQRLVFGDVQEGYNNVYRRAQQAWIPSWNKQRWEADMERIRVALSTAIEEERTRGSPIIFRLYLEAEIRAGHLVNAKRVLFRAISECPLVKDLYLLAFGPLRRVFKNSELQTLVDTMAERGIRLRRLLDEMVKESVEDDGEGSMGEEDEIEVEAREYRRLRPY